MDGSRSAVHLYFCNIESFEKQQLDDGEFVNIERIPIDRAEEMVLNNEIPDAKTQIAVLKAAALVRKMNRQRDEL